MRASLPYAMISANRKREALVSYALQDSFFSGIMHDLNDFGVDISFSLLARTGAYQPFALRTQRLDTPEKHQQFVTGFLRRATAGDVKARMRFSAFAGGDTNAHYFLHEMMHFYQDMHGLYLVPLQEEGVFPVLLDVRGDIAAVLFCEAWAEVEAIRSSWALRAQGDDAGWRGALSSRDWSDLARSYDADLAQGVDEKVAAAACFRRWYEGAHRAFYERHALKIHVVNFKRFCDGAPGFRDADVAAHFRALALPMLLARLPAGNFPSYFALIDWEDALYCDIQAPDVCAQVAALEALYGRGENPTIQDIKCGAPPYLWNRLRAAEMCADGAGV